MKVSVYAIYDVKAKCYSSPFFLPHDGLAVRSFGDLVSDPESRVSVHPKDFDLFRLSTFDDCAGCFGKDVNGVIVADISPPVFLAHASDFSSSSVDPSV